MSADITQVIVDRLVARGIRVHNAEGRGTSFLVYCPMQKDPVTGIISPAEDGFGHDDRTPSLSIFRDNGADGLSYLGQKQIRYVPIKAEIEVNLGPDDLVVYETHRMSIERLNFHFRRSNNREYVDGWDEKAKWIDTVRNYRTKPITFELRRQWPGDADYDSEVATTLFDFQTIEAKFTVPPRGRKQYPATVTRHHGVNKKQERIKLKVKR